MNGTHAANFLPLLIAEGALLAIALVALPIYAASKARQRKDLSLKGLALPQGSVRSMLALIVVGSFVVFLTFGGVALPAGTRFTEIVAALTGVAGSIVGFYFGSGGSSNLSSARESRPRATGPDPATGDTGGAGSPHPAGDGT